MVKKAPKSPGLVETDPEKRSYVAKFDTNYLKKMLILSGIDKQTKEAIKHFLKQSC